MYRTETVQQQVELQELDVKCYLNIVQINHKKMESKYAQVTLTRINSLGLRFLSNLRMPVDENVIWKMNLQLPFQARPFSANGILTNSYLFEKQLEYEMLWSSGARVGRFVLNSYLNPYSALHSSCYGYTYSSNNSGWSQQINMLC